MTPRLFAKLAGGVAYPVAVFGGLLFLGAWTTHWTRAWVLLAVIFVASSVTMFGVFPSRPDLLDERYKAPIQKDQPLTDKILTPLLALSFFGLILIIPIDVFRLHALGATSLPGAALGLVLFAGGWAVMALALHANAFAAPVVKHQRERGQVVVDTGPYRVVRHPMYAGAVPLMIGMPLWLGSVLGVAFAALPLAVLIARIQVEERLLRRELPGYDAYAARVRWRLVPGIW